MEMPIGRWMEFPQAGHVIGDDLVSCFQAAYDFQFFRIADAGLDNFAVSLFILA